MTRSIRTHLLRTLVPPEELAGDCAVIIDVLRATTTIVHALEAGVKTIIPCPEIDIAFEQADLLRQNDEPVLLGGERGGVPVEGFDIGNSPASYTADRVKDRTLVLTTTNGTRALQTALHSKPVLIAAFANLSAVVQSLLSLTQNIHIVCSGTSEKITAEDCLCAGAIIFELVQNEGDWHIQDDQTQLALSLYEQHRHSQEAISQAVHQSLGGRNLHRTNQEHDVDQAALRDTSTIVPTWNAETNRININ